MNGTTCFVKSVTLNFSPLHPTTFVCLLHMCIGERFLYYNHRIILLYVCSVTDFEEGEISVWVYFNEFSGPAALANGLDDRFVHF